MSERGDSHIYRTNAGISEYTHKTTDHFWSLYQKLPPNIQKKADEQFERLKENPNHPSLRLEKLEGDNVYWSARITRQYRAVALKDAESFVWFLIGKHEEVYNLLNR